ncbi:unnamed protein product [Cylindrotheca closterium]|uniref:Uncharacterized protein n=1 Tax=Cylindrotheca closterium TaxID=2856 RepID=A0AAD2FYG8_9STRA|nr:unnamed protein product [Cylindrotheca closterium]
MQVNDYLFQGNEGERAPKSVKRLIVNPGIQVLPNELCYNCERLREVTMPQGLIKIGSRAFGLCFSLLAIDICSTVESIGQSSFWKCQLLAKIDFEQPSSSPHQLRSIGRHAFRYCLSLQRIKVPSSVNLIGMCSFKSCDGLVEAILSSTSIKEIPSWGFAHCRSLQSLSLPSSLERICDSACIDCTCLVTVMVPLGAQPIEIEAGAFYRCRCLANLVLSQGSNASENSFDGCALLRDRFGKRTDAIVAAMINRFDDFPVHKLCYDHYSTTAHELRRCWTENKEEIDASMVDEFGMTPFHVLFSTTEPSGELFEVLLDKFPYHVLSWKDANGKVAMDYLVSNWTDTSTSLLDMTLQKWIFCRLERWCAKCWRNVMIPLVNTLLAEEDKGRRMTVFIEICSILKKYENVEATSILEMTLWKRHLKRGRSNDGTKRQALDREECRCVCGSDVVIPNVIQFFVGIHQ